MGPGQEAPRARLANTSHAGTPHSPPCPGLLVRRLTRRAGGDPVSSERCGGRRCGWWPRGAPAYWQLGKAGPASQAGAGPHAGSLLDCTTASLGKV